MLNGNLATLAVEAFDKEHGAKVQVNGQWLYHDGAVRDAGNPNLCVMRTPQCPMKKQENILAYHEALYREAYQAAKHLRTNLQERQAQAEQNPGSCYVSAPSEEEIAKLAELAEKIKPLHANLTAARAELEKLDPQKTPAAVRLADSQRTAVDKSRTALDAIKF